MWRLEGWVNPYKPRLVTKSREDELWNDCHRAFEAGADAMLEALRKNQWCPYDLSILNPNRRCKVVLIPEE